MPNLNLGRALLSGQWEIDPIAGLSYLAEYMETGQVGKGTDEAVERLVINAQGVTEAVADYSADAKPGSVAHIRMSGPMRLEEGLCTNGVRSIAADIRAADQNPNVSGILFEINSGGGEVVAGTELRNALLDVKRNGRTKVAVYSQLLASAAYRAASPADRIVMANEGSDVGSIGTVLSLNRSVLEYAKKNSTEIYAKQSTLKNHAWRELLKGNEGPIVEMVSDKAARFLADVEASRPGMQRNTDQYKRMAAGDLFSAEEAQKFGLIDAVGTFGEVLNYLQNNQQSNAAPSVAVPAVAGKIQSSMKPRLVRAINSALPFMNLSEDADADQAAEALENAKQGDQGEETPAPAPVTAEQFNELSERIAALTETVEAQAQTIAEQADTIKQSEATNKELSEALAEIKATSTPGHERGKDEPATNGTAIDRKQFETVKALTPANGAKYKAE